MSMTRYGSGTPTYAIRDLDPRRAGFSSCRDAVRWRAHERSRMLPAGRRPICARNPRANQVADEATPGCERVLM